MPLIVVVLTAVTLGALRIGRDALLDSTDGKILVESADPTAPGYQAFVVPTPLMSVAVLDTAGELSSIAVLSLSTEETGAVLVIPSDTLVDDGNGSPVVVRAAFRGGGSEALGNALDRLLGFDSGEILVLDPRGLEQAIRPATPLDLDLAEDVVVDGPGGPELRWEAGEVTLSASEVVEVMLAPMPSATELARTGRIEKVWSAWLSSVSEKGEDAIAGEVDTGIGRFLIGLASRESGVSTPSMLVAPLPGDDGKELYVLDRQGAESMLVSLVPFPVGGFEGQRIRVRLLDGTGTPGASLPVAERIVAAGAEIVSIGNAPEFGSTETELVFYSEENREMVEAVRDALGEGTVRLVESTDQTVDLTIVLGPGALS